MKIFVLAALLLMIFFIGVAGAQETQSFRLNPYQVNLFSPEETGSQFQFTEPSFISFKTQLTCFKFLEYLTFSEFQFEKTKCTLQLGLTHQKPGIITRLKLFNKPIYLTFTFSN